MGLNLQRAERSDVERQFDLPQRIAALLFLSFRLVFALQLDLQWHDVAVVPHRQFQLPGGDHSAVGPDLCLRQAGKLVGLEPRYGSGSELEQHFQIGFFLETGR